MSTVRDAVEVEIKNLIRDAWDETLFQAGEQFTPSIHHGWTDPDAVVYEITASNPDESPVRGGETGYSGIDPTGAGPVRDVNGTIDVNCWADADRTGVNGVSLNPRKAIYLMKWQVEKILGDHPTATRADDTQTDHRWYSPLGARRFVEPDEEPVVWRYQVIAGYGYQDRP